jgi:uncharacterized protein (DUF58 family)
MANSPASQAAGIVATRSELIALGHEPLAAARRRARRVTTLAAGTRASRFRGRGMEFAEVRAYQPGDDVRSIDWRVTARTGRPHSKLFEEERERPIWLLVDLGVSMRFGTRSAFKSVAAARAAALLAWHAHSEGERVGGCVVAPGFRRDLPPGRTRRQLLRFLDLLAAGTSASGDAPSEVLALQLDRLAPRLRSGSRVALVSDFYTLDEGLALALLSLARRCDVTLVFVFDPLECTPPPFGPYRVSDGHQIRTIASGRDSAWQRAIGREFEARRNALQALAHSCPMELVTVRTNDPLAQTRLALAGASAKGERIGAA